MKKAKWTTIAMDDHALRLADGQRIHRIRLLRSVKIYFCKIQESRCSIVAQTGKITLPFSFSISNLRTPKSIYSKFLRAFSLRLGPNTQWVLLTWHCSFRKYAIEPFTSWVFFCYTVKVRAKPNAWHCYRPRLPIEKESTSNDADLQNNDVKVSNWKKPRQNHW